MSEAIRCHTASVSNWCKAQPTFKGRHCIAGSGPHPALSLCAERRSVDVVRGVPARMAHVATDLRPPRAPLPAHRLRGGGIHVMPRFERGNGVAPGTDLGRLRVVIRPVCRRCPVSHPVPAVSHVQELIETHLPVLRPAHQRGLAEWVAGVLAADSGLESAVLAALEGAGVPVEAARKRLREVLCDGPDRAAPCATSLEVEACFAPFLAWVLTWWEGDTLPSPSMPPICANTKSSSASACSIGAVPSRWPGWSCPSGAKAPGCRISSGSWDCWPRPCRRACGCW